MDNGCPDPSNLIVGLIAGMFMIGVGYFFQTNKWGENLAAAWMFYFSGGGLLFMTIRTCVFHIN